MAMVTETTSRKRMFSMQQNERSATWSSPFSAFTPFNLANGSGFKEPSQKRPRTAHKPVTTFKWEPEPELIGKPQMPVGDVYDDLEVKTPLLATWQSNELRGSSLGLSSPPAVKASRNAYQQVKEEMIEREMWHSKLDYSTRLAEGALDIVGRPTVGLTFTSIPRPKEGYYQMYKDAKRELEDYKRVVRAVNSCFPLNASGRSNLSPSLERLKQRGSNLQQGPRNLYNFQVGTGVARNGGIWSHRNRDLQNGETFSTPLYKVALNDEHKGPDLSFAPETPLQASNGPDAVTSTNTEAEGDKKEHWKTLYDKAQNPVRTALLDSTSKDIEATTLRLARIQLTREEGAAQREKDRQASKKDEVSEAFTPLSREAEDAVEDALHNGNRYETLVLHDETNIEVTGAIMQCLLPGAWLNDEVINVYMQLLKERETREPDKFLKCHFFNTFFYNKLFKDKRSYDYKSVRRWTTQKKLGYSLADCDKILIPIHQDIHWCLAVINLREQRFEYLDSLKGQDDNVLKVLARYIVDEAKDKSNKVLDVSKWERAFPEEIPDQLNGCDCGMFMVKYADFHSRGVPLSFTQKHMEYFRRRTVYEILQLKAT